MKQITITVLMAFFVALQVFAERVDMREAGVDNQEALKNTEIINNTINRLNSIHEGERPAAAGEQDGEISRVVRVLAAFRIVVGTGAVKGHVAPGAAVAERVNVAGIKAVPGQPQGAYQQ